MRYFDWITVCAAGMMVAACGGGDGGGINSTPTPSAQANSTLVDLQYSERFTATGADVRFSVAPSGAATLPSFSGGTLTGTTYPTTVSYDSAVQAYTVTNADRETLKFLDTDRLPAESNATITVYEKKNGSTTDNLVLFNTGASNPTISLTYSTYGAWQHIEQVANGIDVRTAFYTFGIKTKASDMPRSGSASYQTTLDGQFASASGVYALSGDSDLIADFGAGTVGFTMNPIGQNIFDGSIKTFGTLAGNGNINFDASSFSAQNSLGQGYNVTLRGGFYGPQANEIGAIFLLSDNGGAGSGAIVGKRQ